MRFPPSIARQGYGEECQELSLRGWKSLLLSAYICVCMRVCMCVCPSLCLRVLFMLECTCLSPGDYDSLPSLRSLSSSHTLCMRSQMTCTILRTDRRLLQDPPSESFQVRFHSWNYCQADVTRIWPYSSHIIFGMEEAGWMQMCHLPVITGTLRLGIERLWCTNIK